MTIGIIAHDAHPIKEPYQGGLEMLTRLLVNELVARGHSVTTLCLEGSDLKGKMVFYSKIETSLSPSEAESDLHRFGHFYKSLNEFLTIQFDILHNHSLNHHAIISGSLTPIPFITSFHTPVFDNLNVALQAIHQAPNQMFTAVSNSLNSVYQEHLITLTTIYNGIDVNAWQTSSITENYFSWCGRICKEKGLIETMDLCHTNYIHLKIAGPIANQDYFDKHVQPRLLKYDCCEYVGHLGLLQVNDLYAKSRAFIFSSTWEEPYGLVIAEALASGTPVIANNIGAASEIITEDCGILFHLNEPQTFSSAILKLNSIDSRKCRERAEEFCSHLKMVDQYETLYHQISVRSAQLA